MEQDNEYIKTIRLKLSTYNKLADLVLKRKRKNLEETGLTGDGNFNDVVNDLINKNNGNNGEGTHSNPISPKTNNKKNGETEKDV